MRKQFREANLGKFLIILCNTLHLAVLVIWGSCRAVFRQKNDRGIAHSVIVN